MAKEYIFHPRGTCSRQMKITYEGDTIVDFEVIGGCPGNLQGIRALVKGKKIEEVRQALSGIRCGAKSTSCPDQLSKALGEIEAQESKAAQ
jgi:uncharacterized protein (TIGR03905 family)